MKNRTYAPARVRSASFDEEANTVDVIWTTGAAVRRYNWDGTEYDEVLSLEPGAVRLERLNSGAPLLDAHQGDALASVIGSVVPNSANIEDGRGVASVLLSKAPGVADTVQKIHEGVIKNISVGYQIYKSVRVNGKDSAPDTIRVVDWEPVELSAVPIPADPGAQIRSHRQRPRDRQSPAQRAAAYARKLLTKTATTSAEARGAAEARTLVGGKGSAHRVERAKPTRFDQEAVNRGARAAKRLLRRT